MSSASDFSNAEIEAGRRLFAGEWNFLSAAGSLSWLHDVLDQGARLLDG